MRLNIKSSQLCHRSDLDHSQARFKKNSVLLRMTARRHLFFAAARLPFAGFHIISSCRFSRNIFRNNHAHAGNLLLTHNLAQL